MPLPTAPLVSERVAVSPARLGHRFASRWLWLSVWPVGLYFACIGLLSIDAPQNDDFQSIVHDLIAYDTAPDRLQWLMAQYVEHRIASVRLVVLAWQRLTGRLNFTALNVLGNLSLVGVLWLLAQWFSRQRALAYFLPVPFILLVLNYHHNTFVSMMALQNLSVLFWAALTLWWIADGRQWRPWVAILPALLCLYTSGNGLLLLPLVIALLLGQRRWRLALVWSVVVLAAVVAYCWQFSPGRVNHKLSFLLPQLPQISAFVVFFVGSYADLLPNVLQRASAHSDSLLARGVFYGRLLIPFGAGLLLLGGGLLCCLRWWLNRFGMRRTSNDGRLRRLLVGPPASGTASNTFIVGMMLFVLLTAVMVAIGRINGGIAQSFAIRYKIYSPLLVCLLYAYATTNWRSVARQRRLFGVALAGSVLIWINSYAQHLSQVQHNRHVTVAGLFNWQTNGTWAVYGSTYGDIDTVLRQAQQRRLYVPDTTLLRPLANLPASLRQPLPAAIVTIDSTERTWELNVAQTPLNLPSLARSPADGGYFVLYDARHTYLIPALTHRDAFGQQTSGLWAFLEQTTHGLAPGTYQVAVMTIQRGQRQLLSSGRQINLRL